MSGIVSMHLADVGAPTALRLLARSPTPGRIDGLRQADVGLAAPLSPSVLPRVGLGRVGLLAFWDDETALDRFTAEHPVAAALAGGWHARLAPVRVHGAWPGLDESVPKTRRVEPTGPAVVLTLGRLRLRHAPRFLRTSAPAEGAALEAPGFRWGTGWAKPPFVATCSLWESDEALMAYAYGDGQRPHPTAIGVDRAKPFHKASAFIRFRTLHEQGWLAGTNPLPAA